MKQILIVLPDEAVSIAGDVFCVTAGGGKRWVAGGGKWSGRSYARLADVGAGSPGRASRYRHPRNRGEGSGAIRVQRRGSKMSA
jgi:hypothetical protein